jgi:hypothetical protein
MTEVFKWGDYLFEVYDKETALKTKAGGVLIFAIKEISSKAQTKWTPVYIEEAYSFSSLSSSRLQKVWNNSNQYGNTFVHLFKAGEVERNLIRDKLIKIYRPAMNKSEDAQSNELPKEDMTTDTQPAGPLVETKSKLDLLFQYEKHYLELIKEYKEEIKFANTMQEDLRREKTQFFTQTLKEVIQTMKTAEIDKGVSGQWIQELVASYTKSIDLSGDLAKTHAVEVLSMLTSETKRQVSDAKLDKPIE